MLRYAGPGGNFISTTRRSEIHSHKKITETVPGLGNVVVHTLDETSFVVKTQNPVLAFLRCNDSTESIQLNQSALLTIPPDCKLESDLFPIHPSFPSKVVTPDVATTFMIDIEHPQLQELSSSNNDSTRKLSWRELIKSNRADLLELGKNKDELEETNSEFKFKVSMIETGIDHIIKGVASGGGTLLLIIIIVTVCLCLVCCRNKNTLSLCCL